MLLRRLLRLLLQRRQPRVGCCRVAGRSSTGKKQQQVLLQVLQLLQRGWERQAAGPAGAAAGCGEWRDRARAGVVRAEVYVHLEPRVLQGLEKEARGEERAAAKQQQQHCLEARACCSRFGGSSGAWQGKAARFVAGTLKK